MVGKVTAGKRFHSAVTERARLGWSGARLTVVACEERAATGSRVHAIEALSDGAGDPVRVAEPLPSEAEPLASEAEPAEIQDRVAELEGLVKALTDLALAPWSALTPEQADTVVQVAERSSRAIASIQASAIAALSKQQKDPKRRSRILKDRIATHTGRSKASSYRAVKAAEHLESDLPETRKALAQGVISEDHVNAIVTWATKTEKHRDRLKDPVNGEKRLIEQAKEVSATQFTKIAKGWATETDPEAADREFQQSAETQTVNLTPVEDGFLFKGMLNHVDGQILQTALAAHMGRKPADDERSFPQRRAEALVGLARQSLDQGNQMRGARIRPHLTVTLDYHTLESLIQAAEPAMPQATLFAHGLHQADEATHEAAQREWAKSWQPGDDHVISTHLDYTVLEHVPSATLPDGTPLAPAALARITCESMLARVVFGPDSTILDAGREQRIFPAHQVRAIIARDRTCQYPGCEEGPEFSEVHHSLEWYKHGGTTHADLGILLCYTHHSHVHQRGITISRTSGRWIFTDAHDRQITVPTLTSDPPPVTPKSPGSAFSQAKPTSAPPTRQGAPSEVVIPAGEPFCSEEGEQSMLTLESEPPF